MWLFQGYHRPQILNTIIILYDKTSVLNTALRTYKGRTYKGQFTFFEKIYWVPYVDTFLQETIFTQTFFIDKSVKIIQKKFYGDY